MTRGTRRLCGLAVMAVALILAGSSRAPASQPASPDVEVKFILDPSRVLDAQGQPAHELRAAFQITQPPKAIRMEFLDGPRRELNHEGWNIRFRKLEGKDHIELTFKRRYPVEGGLDATLAEAARDGFDAAQNDYEAELDWSYRKQTLTFANQHRAGDEGKGDLNLPSVAQARTLALDKMPDKLRHLSGEGWAARVLSDARLYGPVNGRRWRGSRAEIGGEIAIEVWTLPNANRNGTEPIVEISFKAARYGRKLVSERAQLLAFLNGKGWMLDQDELKTEMILECCGPSGH